VWHDKALLGCSILGKLHSCNVFSQSVELTLQLLLRCLVDSILLGAVQDPIDTSRENYPTVHLAIVLILSLVVEEELSIRNVPSHRVVLSLGLAELVNDGLVQGFWHVILRQIYNQAGRHELTTSLSGRLCQLGDVVRVVLAKPF
jgi:hypothetical protein